jgi:hypothetical protein
MPTIRVHDQKNLLTNMTPGAKIGLVKLSTEEFVVTTLDGTSMSQTKEQIIDDKFSGLRKQPIRLSDASKKYDVSTANLTRWMQAGYIEALTQEPYNTLLDEADTAYCAFIYHERKKQGVTFGSRLFDENGNPYELKHPDLAKRRRKKH